MGRVGKDIQRFIIRFFDILFSSLAIIVLLPFMLPIMLALKLTGEHDIFYRQARVGRHGKEFGVLKFATMLRNSPNLPGGTFTYTNDPRILPLGKFLRKTKINELPQLLNILAGQMSVVGYRPLVPAGYAKYSEATKKKIYDTRPGLTGIGSVVLIHEEEIMQRIEDKDGFYRVVIIPYKAALEEWFVDNSTVGAYFKVILATVAGVLMPASCFYRKLFPDLPDPPQELVEYLREN